MIDETPARQLIRHLMRGGSYGYWWQAEGRKSLWWPTTDPAPVPRGDLNIYFGVHPTTEIPPVNRDNVPTAPEAVRSQIRSLAAINCLFGEFDAKDFEGSKEQALAHIRFITPAPSVIIDSGGGYHAYWLLDEPCMIEDDDQRDFIKRLQAGWVMFVESDDESKDIARILRVPGTRNCKKTKQGEYLYGQPLPITIIDSDFTRLYTLDELVQYCEDFIPSPNPEPMIAPGSGAGGDLHGRQILSRAISMVVLAPDGKKHTQLFYAARLAGGCPSLSDYEIETALVSAIQDRATDREAARHTILDGIRRGRVAPIEPPKIPQPHFNDQGVACCPTHRTMLMRAKNGHGWRCQILQCFWWEGINYDPPELPPPKGVNGHGVSEVSPSISEVSTPSDTPMRPPWLLDEEQLSRLPPPTWLIENVIISGEVTVIVGDSDAGKTFLVVDMAERVAQHYPVIYVAGEDARGIGIRKAAWEQHHRRGRSGRFWVRDRPLSLADESQVADFLAWSHRLSPRLIVFDTLSQCAEGIDENNAKEMTLVLGNAQRIAHETGAAVIIIHHTNRQTNTFRGSGTIKANTYGFIKVENQDGTIKMECERIKNFRGFGTMMFRLIEVSLGCDTSSCVPLPARSVLPAICLTRDQYAVLSMLALITDADDGATTKDLESACGLPRASFYRAFKRLKERHCVTVEKKNLISNIGRQILANEGPDSRHEGGDIAFDAPLFVVNERLLLDDLASESQVSQVSEASRSGINPSDTSEYHQVSEEIALPEREVSEVSSSINGSITAYQRSISSLSLLRRADTDTSDTDPPDHETGPPGDDDLFEGTRERLPHEDVADESVARRHVERKNFAVAERFARSIRDTTRRDLLLQEITMARNIENGLL